MKQQQQTKNGQALSPTFLLFCIAFFQMDNLIFLNWKSELNIPFTVDYFILFLLLLSFNFISG